ncbi:MAG: RNA polymerase sigma factor [Candidatus Nanopelagicales bacterium]
MTHDEAWFAQTVETYLHSIYSFIYRRSQGLDPAISSAEDIVADTWAIAWQKREQAPEDEGLVAAWLYQIARHLLANHIRRTQTLRKHSAALDPDLVSRFNAEGLVIADDELKRVFNLLSDGEKEVLALTLWEGLEPRHIAHITSSTPNAVSLKLHKARKKISEYYEKEKQTS